MSHLRMTTQEYLARNLKKQGRIKNVKKKVIDGIEFASTKEARAWQDFCLQQKAGQITDLRRQIVFHLDVDGTHICDYVADFTFRRNGTIVVADAKGFRTDIFKLKRKLMKAVWGIEIEEV